MRRKVIDLTKVSLAINTYVLDNGFARIEYYNLNGDLTKMLCKDDLVFLNIEKIKEEREKFWCVKDGKTIYPFRRNE